MTVVIAEDDTDIREFVTMILEDEGYRVVATVDGRQALLQCQVVKPALALLDITMPGDLNGLDVTRALRADPATQDMHIFLVTARAQDNERAAGLKAGADEYIVKPFDPAGLIAKVGAVLGDKSGS